MRQDGKMKLIEEMKLSTYVVISLSLIILYTMLEFIFSTLTGVSHDTLTTCYYAVFGGEVISCALIKIFKLKCEEEDDSMEWEDIKYDDRSLY